MIPPHHWPGEPLQGLRRVGSLDRARRVEQGERRQRGIGRIMENRHLAFSLGPLAAFDRPRRRIDTQCFSRCLGRPPQARYGFGADTVNPRMMRAARPYPCIPVR